MSRPERQRRAHEVPSGFSIDESADEGDSTTEPAECSGINGVDTLVAAGSAQIRFKQSTFGPFLIEALARSTRSPPVRSADRPDRSNDAPEPDEDGP